MNTAPSDAAATGRPASAQAAKPPSTSVARDRPRSCRDAAASEEVYPSAQITMTR